MMGIARRDRWARVSITIACSLIFWACSAGEAPPSAVDCPDGVAAADGASAGSDGGSGADHDGAIQDGANQDGGAPAKRSATDRLFEPNAPLRTVNLDLKPQDWTWLQAHAAEETYVPCTVTADVSGQGEPAKVQTKPAFMRFKGSYGSLFSCFEKSGPKAGQQTCKKLSIKVSFNREQKKGRMFGVRKLILNACNRDATCLRERLAYSLFRRAGIEAPRAVHVLVRVNGGPASLYTLVENIDKEFLEDHFNDPEGNLYKEAWPAEATPLRVAQWKNAQETNEKAGDVSRLISFAKALSAWAESAAGQPGAELSGDVDAKRAAFAKVVDPWIDRAQMARYFAVDQLTNNWDGIWKFYCGKPGAGQPSDCNNHNFFLYDDPSSGRFVVVPWDLDHTFNQPNTDMARDWWLQGAEACALQQSNPLVATRRPQCDPLLRGLMRFGWKDYVAHVDAWTAAGGVFDQAHLQAELDTYRAQIYAAMAADPLGPGLVPWLSATAQLRETLPAQVKEARALLTWKPPAQP